MLGLRSALIGVCCCAIAALVGQTVAFGGNPGPLLLAQADQKGSPLGGSLLGGGPLQGAPAGAASPGEAPAKPGKAKPAATKQKSSPLGGSLLGGGGPSQGTPTGAASPAQPPGKPAEAKPAAADQKGSPLGGGSLLGGSLLQGAPAGAASPGQPPAEAKPAAADQKGSPLGGSLLGGGGLLQGAPAGNATIFTGKPAAAPAEATPAAADQKGSPPGGSPLGGGLLQGAPAGGATVFTGKPPAAPAEAKPAEAKPGSPGEETTVKKTEKEEEKAGEEHAALYKENQFPSAVQCGECHPKQFREWSVSQHAYAEVSVVFHAMQHQINVNLNGSNGDFCARCHSAVAGFLDESPDAAVLERHAVSREGITCISCHRISNAYNKVSGRLAFHPGQITEPVYGPTGDKELKRVLKDPKYHVEPDPDKVGRHIHADIVAFAPIRSSTFCGSCHDVTLFNGFRLEEAFSEYRTSPAAAAGTTCQDCHMGKVQGKVSGYDFGPAAEVDGVTTTPRRLTNHLFSGPDYPIVHPGVFPFNKKAQGLANVNEWTQFDYKAGWGTDAFEKNLPPGYTFPQHWQSVDDRYDAAAIIQDQLKLLDYHKQNRLEVLRNGFAIGAVTTAAASSRGIDLSVEVKSLTGGHNVPTGFTAERPIWLEVTVADPNGKVIYRSGDRDPNGDLRDRHSEWVRAGKVPLDSALLNLQSEVLVRNLRGSERSAILPTPFTQNALPYIRPSTFSQIMLGRPTGARNQKISIEPLGHRTADYSIDGDAMSGPGTYHVTLRLMSQAVPINLLLATQRVGFDYNLSPQEVVDNVIDGAVAIDEQKFDINIQ